MDRRTPPPGDALSACTALEPLWHEAHRNLTATSPGSPERELWQRALDLLVHALQEGEHLVARTNPGLGRRRWADRTPRPPGPTEPATAAGEDGGTSR